MCTFAGVLHFTSGVVAKVRLVVDFRSDRMETPEGRGKARQAWDAYAGAVTKVTTPSAGGRGRLRGESGDRLSVVASLPRGRLGRTARPAACAPPPAAAAVGRG
jgi:hypothetical protein